MFQAVLCRDALVQQDESLQVMGYQGDCLVASPYPDLLDAVQERQLSIHCVVPVWQRRLLFAAQVSAFGFHRLSK